jgi:hypothetical protein
MNEFVNYGTRDVSLPKGFTELIEVMHSDQAPGIIRRTTEGLRQLDGYLSTLMSSPSKHGILSILGFDLKAGVYLENSKGVLSATVAIRAANSAAERTVRECFRLAGVAPLSDELPGGGAISRVLKYPLPASIPDIGLLISEVLRAACGATDHAGLYYGYYNAAA